LEGLLDSVPRLGSERERIFPRSSLFSSNTGPVFHVAVVSGILYAKKGMLPGEVMINAVIALVAGGINQFVAGQVQSVFLL
jgi:hypothetical protein